MQCISSIKYLLILFFFLSQAYPQEFWKHIGLENYFIGYMAEDSSGRLYASEWQGFGDSLFYSDDSGQSWQSYGEVNDSFYINISRILILDNNDILISAWGQNGGVYKSTDSSLTWEKKNSGFQIADVSYIYKKNDSLYAAAYDGIYLSVDAAENWVKLNSVPDTIVDARSIVIAPNNNFFTIDQNTVLKSIDNGVTWDTLTLRGYSYINPTYLIITQDKYLFVGTDFRGIFNTTDWGLTWTQNLTPNNVRNIAFNSVGNIIIGNEYSGVQLSVDNGESWQQINKGLPVPPYFINCVFFDSKDYAYCSVHNYGIFKSISPVVSVDEIYNHNPISFRLYQNYPNPFNPNTKIKYSIPSVGSRDRVSVQLIVSNILGKEVATLVNEEKPAGNYEIEFDGTGLPSGIYFYQLKAGSFVETKKMMLLK